MLSSTIPVRPEIAAQPQRQRSVLCFDGELQRRSKVLLFDLQPIQPAPLLRAVEEVACVGRQRQESVGVGAVQPFCFVACIQPLQGVLADRLQHGEPRLAVLVLAAVDKALIE